MPDAVYAIWWGGLIVTLVVFVPLAVYSLHRTWRSARSIQRYVAETLQAAAARADRLREVFRNPSEASHAGAWDRFSAALDDDFNTPEALAELHEWRDHDLLRRALDIFGLGSLAETEAAPAEVIELAERRQQARSGGDFDEADRLRTEIDAAGWEVRDVAEGFQLVPK